VRRTRVLNRLALHEPGTLAVASLHALRRDWRGDAVVRPALELAQREARDARWLTLAVDRAPDDRA
jgi:hypothetical protein